MIKYRVFIEGNGYEQLFLEALIKYISPNIDLLEFDFISSGGWTNLASLKVKFEEATDLGAKSIVIFDADNLAKDPQHGGCEKRTEKLKRDVSPNEFSLFLFPNNIDDGDLEVLLEHIINPNHRPIIDCFNAYESCLAAQLDELTGLPKYKLPVQKSKMYTYVDSIYKSRKEDKEFIKNKNWFFYKPEYWNFDQPYLNSLKIFLLNLL